MSPPLEPWLEPVRERLAEAAGHGGCLVGLPDYRPDLVRAMAHGLGLTFFDYRAEVMRPEGWRAHELTLDQLDRTLAERSGDTGLAVHNAEALLATKSPSERADWLEAFVETRWPRPMLASLFLFADSAPHDHPRVIKVAAAGLPEETMLGRLLFWGS